MDFQQADKHMVYNKYHITADHIGFSNNQKRVTIIDHLTERNLNLLREAEPLRSQEFKYVIKNKFKMLKNEITNKIRNARREYGNNKIKEAGNR